MNNETKKHAAPAGPQGQAVVSAAYVDPLCTELITLAVQQRLALGISCYEVARRAQISPSTVSRMEAHKMTPTLNVMQRYCRVCGLRLIIMPA
jgi:DNA-binding XRE family transcriptional regulator